MKLVIKVGTQSILSHNGEPFLEVMEHLVDQIADLQQTNNHQIILVSSGAVSSGRKKANNLLKHNYGHSIAEKQVLAALGQHELINLYSKLFKAQSLLTAQLLLTKQDFQTRKHYLNISRLLEELLGQKNIIPVINENDSVAIEELMFTDNDELAGLIAAQINADKLIILSNVDGVYTDSPEKEGAKLINQIDPNNGWPDVSTSKSLHGRGGMHSKLNTAKKAANLGITTHIAGISEQNILKRILNGEHLGSTILPNKKKSSIKRWIAYNMDKQRGRIYVNERLNAILMEKQRAISLLPVGIERYDGSFKKGELVEIRNGKGDKIGVGIARYDYNKLLEYIGKQDKPVFIHYDHLHIF